MSKHAFTDLSTAAYCPRKLYYERRHDRDPPDVSDRRDLAVRYDELLDASDARLRDLPLAVSPTQFRDNLARARERFDCWPALVDPAARDVLLEGRECRGIGHKLLGTDPPLPSLVFTGAPPPQGVWAPQSVRAVAAAKALSWERERSVERTLVEYPAHGVVRTLSLTTRRKAAYREAVRVVEQLDGPPPRIDDRAKCGACEFSDECGVRTRTLRSLLG